MYNYRRKKKQFITKIIKSINRIGVGGHNIMTRGSLFAYNIMTPPPLTSGVRECKVVKLFYFYQMSELYALLQEKLVFYHYLNK